ncbi:MAG: sensor histidine kinase, partial [Nocardioides sp.]
ELQALDAYKGRLISTVAHELKNPLAAVMGHLELLTDTEDLPPDALPSLAAMERSTGRLFRTIESLLMLSKVGDPAHPLIAAPVDLRRIILEVVDLTDVSARTKEIDLRVEAPPEIVSALGDNVELDQVVLNLVSNAVKYTREGGRVDVALREVGGWVELTVADTGLGISEKDQGALFSEFFRSSNPEAVRQPGSGLGLAIVKRIVERHQGSIEVESALGEGTTFRVLLPAAA